MIKLAPEEVEALYYILKDYQKNSPESDEEYYNDYQDEYEEPISKKIIVSLIKKISSKLPKETKEEINKDFLRQKYHTYNNEINEKAYSIIEKAFSQLKTVEISYFNMENAQFKNRKIDIYYKSRKYTIGYCHLRKAIRKFRTSRIGSAKLIDQTYQFPKNFDKNNY